MPDALIAKLKLPSLKIIRIQLRIFIKERVFSEHVFIIPNACIFGHFIFGLFYIYFIFYFQLNSLIK